VKVTRKIIEIDEDLCDGCGNCIVSCAEGALKIVDGKARLVAELYCDGIGACLGECPTGALQIVNREADEFDETAVEHHLEQLRTVEQTPGPTLPCGCPSAQVPSFAKQTQCQMANAAVTQAGADSALTNWPVQIRLVPPTARFLKNADLLVAADCTPFAYPSFHKDFLEGRVLMVGCPKFDDAQAYVEKFADIFETADIRSVTVVVMEVPCCQGLPVIVRKAMENAGKSVPLEYVIVGTRGEIERRQLLVA
jgi:Pyruvate/2-oxoacid:ferredoxin oxidoreductase delta subunit